MSLSVKHYNGSWIDISDYVVGAGDVPYISRNRDWTARAESLTVQVASTIRDHASYADDFIFSKGDLFAIWSDSTLLFNGYAEKAPLNYDTMIFEVEIRDNLQKLENYLVDYDTLHTQFATGTQWYEYESNDSLYAASIIGILWAMKCIFVVAGYTLDVSAVKDEVIFTQTNWSSVTVTYQDLMCYEMILWCLGQSIATSHATIDDATKDYRKNKKNCFEYVAALIGALNLAIVPSSATEYKLILATGNYSLSDVANPDSVYEYSKEFFYKEVDINALGIKNQVNSFSDAGGIVAYNSAAETSIPVLSTGEQDQIEYMMNFVIVCTDAKSLTNKYDDTYQYQYCVPSATTDFVITSLAGLKWINPCYNRVREKSLDYKREVITAPLDVTVKTVVENFIDLENRTSKIVQETYL